jgi:hypothetical protein
VEEPKIDFAEIKDNSVVVILKNEGKLFQLGLQFMPITPGIADEDLESELAAIDTLCLTIKNTLRHKLANREIPPEEVEEFTDLDYIKNLNNTDRNAIRKALRSERKRGGSKLRKKYSDEELTELGLQDMIEG